MVEFESAVDFFAQFWIRMETILDAVSDRVDDLRGKKHLRMRLMTIRKDWEVVHSNFLDYVHKVSTNNDTKAEIHANGMYVGENSRKLLSTSWFIYIPDKLNNIRCCVREFCVFTKE